MSPTPRLALALAAIALGALVLPVAVAVAAALVLAGAALADARGLRGAASFDRRLAPVLSRGVPARLELSASLGGADPARLRQSSPAALDIEPAQAGGTLVATVVPRLRGRHAMPPAAARFQGPLGLMTRDSLDGSVPQEVCVYPDLPAARRLAVAVRGGGLREEGRLRHGPLGLGTEFEAVRDYLPDDDIRVVNWPATGRLGRPMSNQYRVEQDRDVLFLIDTGRLMAAPLGDRTRLDAALDAMAAVAMVADAVGDRCGAVAFAEGVHRHLRPRRGGGEVAIRALFDLEATPVESDYELAFRTAGGGKRSFVLLFTDLIEESAARPLAEAVPVLARRHLVAIATVADPDLAAAVCSPAHGPREAYAAAVAADVLDARAGAAAGLARAGAVLVEAGPRELPAACVRAYLRAKARARV